LGYIKINIWRYWLRISLYPTSIRRQALHYGAADEFVCGAHFSIKDILPQRKLKTFKPPGLPAV
jgi:hypothetical protein